MNRDFANIKPLIPSSPAFVLDEEQLIANIQPLLALRQQTGCKILYSMKALPLAWVLELLKQQQIDGISVSSLFEARLAKQVFTDQGSIHLTTPGIRPDEMPELSQVCSHISFNSLPQYERLHWQHQGYSKGLRLNPKLSFVSDSRYDPCRCHSKLGIDSALLDKGIPTDIEGLHFHTMFGGDSFAPLLQTIEQIRPLLNQQHQLQWLNLGGGYLYNSISDQTGLIALIKQIKTEYGLEVYVEPGNAIVCNAGYLMTTVIDRFISDNQTILVLDTSVNHLPEAFEYQIKPQLLEEQPDGEEVILAGSTCLAGDLFGRYRFQRIPIVGERLVFTHVGAYSLIKAHRFNGYNLPDVYRLKDSTVHLIKHYEYAEYQRQWG